MNTGTQIVIPPAPSFPGFGPELQETWCKTYKAAVTEYRLLMMESGKQELADDLSDQEKAGRRAANRILRVPVVASYDEAMALEPWQFVRRETTDAATLKLVTIDAKKYLFAIPEERQKR